MPLDLYIDGGNVKWYNFPTKLFGDTIQKGLEDILLTQHFIFGIFVVAVTYINNIQ